MTVRMGYFRRGSNRHDAKYAERAKAKKTSQKWDRNYIQGNGQKSSRGEEVDVK